MFTIDDKLKGLPVSREQVVVLYASLNSPHLAIPGKQAGPAQAFILGVRAGAGFGVYVYLYLPESADCAVYTAGRKALAPEEYKATEAEAHAFVESMGFMMDNLNFRTVPADRQDQLLKTLPVFQRELKAAPPEPKAKPETKSSAASLGRLFASF